jgi:TatA/E family protein of Tat protein translocase
MHPTPVLALFTLSPSTLAIMLVVGILLFGKRLPEIGKTLAKGMREFQNGLNDIGSEVTGSFASPARPALPQREPSKLLPAPAPEVTDSTGPIA